MACWRKDRRQNQTAQMKKASTLIKFDHVKPVGKPIRTRGGKPGDDGRLTNSSVDSFGQILN